MSRGVLVVFEGPEGAGKTTQARRLADWLRAARIPCAQHREPGGTPLGERVRELLLTPGAHVVEPAEALLFMASRAQLVATQIEPALRDGTVVILDRFFLSTYAYQVVGRGLDESLVRAANRLATGGVLPDVTILLTLPTRDGFARAAARGAHDRMEQAGDAFHERVGDAFELFAGGEWQRAHPEAGRIVRVDASGSVDDVFERVLLRLREALPETFAATARGER